MPHRLTCKQCGATFDAKRSDARYCGDACRQEVHRGIPPHRDRPRERHKPNPPPPKELHPDRRAWLAFDSTRCWFRMNFDEPHMALEALLEGKFVLHDPRWDAHAEADQHWIGKRALGVTFLRDELRALGAEVIDTDWGGPLPPVWLLELQSSPNELERAIVLLLLSLPQEQWRPLVRQLAALAHTDKPAAHRPQATDALLSIALALKDLM